MSISRTILRAAPALARARVSVSHRSYLNNLHHNTFRCTLTTSPKRRPTPLVQSEIKEEVESTLDWSLTLFSRILAGCGLVHLVSEYGVELTKCEGPSMMPTILPTGDEIILFERWTHRLWGLHGGDCGAVRCQRAREAQTQFEQTTGKRTWYDALSLVTTEEESASHLSKYVNLWHRLGSGIAVGDVVVLQHPEREGTICKRVLGLPGDMVIRSNPLHSSRRGSIPDLSIRDDDPDLPHNLYQEQEPSLLVIPDGHIWVEGDNSNNSSDSRQYGPVPAALVLGKVLIRIWPLRGNALIIRGPRPLHTPADTHFTGSTILPAGYEGEDMK